MIVIGTRGSQLALVQARSVSAALAEMGVENKIKILVTKGDVVQDRFDKMEGKGFFTKEIEDALLGGDIDLAVHCLKDLPTEDAPGLTINAILEREDPTDVLIARAPLKTDRRGAPDLSGKTVGTSSNRRVYGLRDKGKDVRFVPIRGNVPTRIAKMERGQADAVVLARAGLNRLGLALENLFVYSLAPPILVPAPAQGALALQTRLSFAEDLSPLRHESSARCVRAERQILRDLGGGCQTPLGVLIRARAAGAFSLDLFLGDADDPPKNLQFELRGESPESLVEQALTRIRSARA